ncbi:transposase [Streptomyces sp. NPDC053427]|uniref:transposase n=1 Tax=Streptomyces sp. NPDC053427 TaxID=3365701 RepID=UPI0037D29975
MTDQQCAIVEPHLPSPANTRGRGGRRPERHPRRLVLDAIFYVVRGGIACPFVAYRGDTPGRPVGRSRRSRIRSLSGARLGGLGGGAARR